MYTYYVLTFPWRYALCQDNSSEAVAVHKELRVQAANIGRALGVTQTVGDTASLLLPKPQVPASISDPAPSAKP